MTQKFTVGEAIRLVGRALNMNPDQVVETAMAICYLRAHKNEDVIERILCRNFLDPKVKAGLERLKQRWLESSPASIPKNKGGEKMDLLLLEELSPKTREKLREVTAAELSSLDEEIGAIIEEQGLSPSLPAESVFRFMPNELKRRKLISLVNLIR
jgi:hypothetical protein